MMGSVYPHSPASTSWSPRKIQHSHVERALGVARGLIADVQNLWGHAGRRRRRRPFWQDVRSVMQSAFTVTTFLAIVWMYVLWWGERTVFRQSVDQCLWEKWENWVGLISLLHGKVDRMLNSVNHSLRTQCRIMSSSWRIHNWSILIHIPTGLGLCRP